MRRVDLASLLVLAAGSCAAGASTLVSFESPLEAELPTGRVSEMTLELAPAAVTGEVSADDAPAAPAKPADPDSFFKGWKGTVEGGPRGLFQRVWQVQGQPICRNAHGMGQQQPGVADHLQRKTVQDRRPKQRRGLLPLRVGAQHPAVVVPVAHLLAPGVAVVHTCPMPA